MKILGDMMSKFQPMRALPWLLSCLILVSCLGTEVKTLGQKAVGGTGTGVTDSDTFSITLAYRKDENPDDGRLVVLQGVRDIPSAALINHCGTTGSTCQCVFYKGVSDPSPRTNNTPNGLSSANNSYSCSIPTDAGDPDDYTKVRLRRVGEPTKSTGFIDIKTSLTLDDVIGDLSKTKVRGVLRYGCSRTFFEGEGVSPTQVTCPAAQRLGLISATYNYYLYNSQDGGNLGEKGSNSAYPDPICERQFTKLNCDGAADLRWGLYAERAGPFQVAITMTSKPEGENATSIYGYAALPDSAGNCPTGLVKVRPWMAQPQSIVQGSINGNNPPSSFVNQANNLNNTVVEESQPDPFRVFRQPNTVTCEVQHNQPAPRPAPGSCTPAQFGGTVQVQSVTYTQLTPIVCAIPKSLLSGLF